jgi:hypothetical protein
MTEGARGQLVSYARFLELQDRRRHIAAALHEHQDVRIDRAPAVDAQHRPLDDPGPDHATPRR